VLAVIPHLTAEVIEKEEQMAIVIDVGGKSVIFSLNDSSSSKDLFNQLPLTVQLEDFGRNEKIFYPQKKLGTKGTPLAKAHEAKAGTLAYYAPWGDVVLFYEDFSPASGLYVLGKVVSGLEFISTLKGSARVSISTN
jgi:hypothetical protein